MSSPFLRRALTSSTPIGTLPLEVIRICFNLAIILYHAALCLAFCLSSSTPASALINDFSSVPAVLFQFVNFGFRYGVDAFFFLSGFCMAPKVKAFFRDGKSGASLGSVSHYLLFRWLRLVPMYAIASMLLFAMGKPTCPSIPELLFYGNLLVRFQDRCLAGGWSTLVDFQAHIAICVLAIACRSFRNLKVALCVCIVGCGLARISKWYMCGFPFPPLMVNIQDMVRDSVRLRIFGETYHLRHGGFDSTSQDVVSRQSAYEAFSPLYFELVYRLTPFMVAFLVWCEMHQRGYVYRMVVRRKAAAVLTALVLMLVEFWAVSHFHATLDTFNKFFGAMHVGFGSVFVLLGLGLLVMVSCIVEGEEGGEAQLNGDGARRSDKQYVIRSWSRKLYALYQLHPIFMRSMSWVGGEVNDGNFSHSVILVKGLMLYGCTLAFSIPVSAVEQVFLEMRSLLKRWTKAASAKRAKEE